MIKNRSEFDNNYDWLYYLFNNLGCSDLAIQMSGINKNNEIWFSKRYKFIELLEKEPESYISIDNAGKYKIKVIDFINKSTHRTICDIEICFDIDEEPILDNTLKILNKYAENEPRCYFTGSKSYHIHFWLPELRLNNNLQKYKEIIIKRTLNKNNADIQKTKNNLIAIEGQPHYKSGKIKERVV